MSQICVRLHAGPWDVTGYTFLVEPHRARSLVQLTTLGNMQCVDTLGQLPVQALDMFALADGILGSHPLCSFGRNANKAYWRFEPASFCARTRLLLLLQVMSCTIIPGVPAQFSGGCPGGSEGFRGGPASCCHMSGSQTASLGATWRGFLRMC